MFGAVLYALLINQIPIADYHPGLDWKTIETEHFYIHFPEALNDPARGLAGRAEPIYHKITERLSWEPHSKTHIVLSDLANPNGVATPVPYNTVHLFAKPPSEDTSLDSYDDWLTMLFTHEFTHTVHIDMATGINRVLRNILGRIIVPNAIEPQWLIEGLAMYHETEDTTAGRGRSSFIDMYFRTSAIEEEFLPIERASYWNDIYPYGNTAYWYGVRFHQYLAKKYGEDKIYALAKTNSRWLIPGWFNFKTDDIYGKSFDRLWEEWKTQEYEEWKKIVSSRKAEFEGSPLDAEDRLIGKPAWNKDGSILYAPVIHEERSYLVAYLFHPTTKEFQKREVIRAGLVPRSLSFNEEKLYYAKESFVSRYHRAYDIYSFDLNEKKELRLTKGLRLEDPTVYKNKIFATHSNQYKSSLVEFPLVDTKDDEFKPLHSLSQLKFHYTAPETSVITKPSVSPDGESLVFSMKKSLGYRDLYLLNLKTKVITQLTFDEYVDNYPYYKDATSIVFNSDRPLPGHSTKVWNVYELDLASDQMTALTDVWTGTTWPVQRGKELALGVFTSDGFEVRRGQIKKRSASVRVAKQAIPHHVPPLLGKEIPKARMDLEAKDYSAGTTLLPHYLLPFFLITEDDSAYGSQIGSNDPLGFHLWSAFGYFLTDNSFSGPNRPGGILQYLYRGIPGLDFLFGGSAGIRSYGSTILRANNADIIDDYYERVYRGYVGLGHQFLTNNGPLGLSNQTRFYYTKKSSLLGYPTGTQAGFGDVPPTGTTLMTNVGLRPVHSQSFGANTTFTYDLGFKKDMTGTAPHRGGQLNLSIDYAPDQLSDLHTLITTFSTKFYFEIIRDLNVGFYGAIGNQWLDTIYQKTFLMGGSFGTGPFNLVDQRSFALRGLPTSDLSGEGIVNGSIEMRFPILKYIPGFGTAPVWIKNIHAAVFSDYGQAFQYQSYKNLTEVYRGTVPQDLDYNRWTVSTGAELRSDVSISYAPPLTFRIGYGYVLYRIGQNVVEDQIDQFYFQLGQSF